MKSDPRKAEALEKTSSLFANSRFFNRVNAVCTVFLTAGFFALGWLVLQPNLGPDPDNPPVLDVGNPPPFLTPAAVAQNPGNSDGQL